MARDKETRRECAAQVMNVTCPVSAHLERIAFTEHPDGTIVCIDGCTAFEPESDVSCDQVCASRLNQRRRLERARMRGVKP